MAASDTHALRVETGRDTWIWSPETDSAAE
jgi:hypothetical protein